MVTPSPYEGSADRPRPPVGPGWIDVAWEDESARARALELAAQATVGVGLGEPPELPIWHYRDELLPTGLYRFYHYESAHRPVFGAMRYVGVDGRGAAGTLGANEGPPTAADQMNSAIAANGYRAADMYIYKAFQTWAQSQGLYSGTIDGFPGQGTMAALAKALQAEGVTLTSRAYSPSGGFYPWKAGPGYDGVNAPTQAQWCSGGPGEDPGACGAGDVHPIQPAQNTSEPIPQNTSSCAWVADASNSYVNGVATTIVNEGTPTPWTDQGIYNLTAPDGTKWMLVMWWENGTRAVAAYRCAPPAAVSTASMGVGAVILGVLVVGGLVVAGLAGHKPV